VYKKKIPRKGAKAQKKKLAALRLCVSLFGSGLIRLGFWRFN
jgi:hypothetical protein